MDTFFVPIIGKLGLRFDTAPGYHFIKCKILGSAILVLWMILSVFEGIGDGLILSLGGIVLSLSVFLQRNAFSKSSAEFVCHSSSSPSKQIFTAAVFSFITFKITTLIFLIYAFALMVYNFFYKTLDATLTGS